MQYSAIELCQSSRTERNYFDAEFNLLTPERAFRRASKYGVPFVLKKALKGPVFCQMILYVAYMKFFIVKICFRSLFRHFRPT